ncbi:hypothetical protein [Nocardia sp. NPDC024068]|uniref:hypothetical protein n=1 Tax=Nocardia sp. NPDC024068 TaxID=3157197 RepID=UPI0033E5378C
MSLFSAGPPVTVAVGQLWFDRDRWLLVESLAIDGAFAMCRVVAKRVADRVTAPGNSVLLLRSQLVGECELAESVPAASPPDFAVIGIDRRAKRIRLDGAEFPYHVVNVGPRVRRDPDGSVSVVVTFHARVVDDPDLTGE